MYLQRIRTVVNIGLILLLSISLLGCSQKCVDNNQLDNEPAICDSATAENSAAESGIFEDVPLEANELPQEEPAFDESDSEPPFSLYFAGMDDLILFLEAEKLSGEGFDTFIKEKQYYQFGVKNKEDLKEIRMWFEDTPIPVSKQFNLKGITIFPESKEVHFLFENESGNRCSFNIYMDNTTTFDDCLQTRIDKNMPFEDVSIPENPIVNRMLFLDKNTSPNLYASPAFYFLLDYENCFADYRTFGIQDYGEAVDALCEFSYSGILSLSVQ